MSLHDLLGYLFICLALGVVAVAVIKVFFIERRRHIREVLDMSKGDD